jgi:hypothetical protein
VAPELCSRSRCSTYSTYLYVSHQRQETCCAAPLSLPARVRSLAREPVPEQPQQLYSNSNNPRTRMNKIVHKDNRPFTENWPHVICPRVSAKCASLSQALSNSAQCKVPCTHSYHRWCSDLLTGCHDVHSSRRPAVCGSPQQGCGMQCQVRRCQ